MAEPLSLIPRDWEASLPVSAVSKLHKSFRDHNSMGARGMWKEIFFFSKFIKFIDLLRIPQSLCLKKQMGEKFIIITQLSGVAV